MNSKVTDISLIFRNGDELNLPIKMIDVKANNYEKQFKRQTPLEFGTIDVYNFVYINIREDFHLLREIEQPHARFKREYKIDTLKRVLFESDLSGLVFYNDDVYIEGFGVPWPANITEGASGSLEKRLLNPLQVNRVNENGDVEIMIATNSSMKENRFDIDCYQDSFYNTDIMKQKWESIFYAERLTKDRTSYY